MSRVKSELILSDLAASFQSKKISSGVDVCVQCNDVARYKCVKAKQKASELNRDVKVEKETEKISVSK